MIKTCKQNSHKIHHVSPYFSGIIHRFADESKNLLLESIVAEYLFGSYAKNNYTPRSDIDILILVKNFTPDMQRQLSGLASDYSFEYDVYISPIVKDIEVWKKNQMYHTLFYQELTQYGIAL
jgi:predicted nucleotidyltransferase